MTTGSSAQRHGEVFDAVAEAYDRVRPGYPDELVDAACTVGALDAGCRVLEVGCGTGKLTEALVGGGVRSSSFRSELAEPGPRFSVASGEDETRLRLESTGAAASAPTGTKKT